MVVALLLGRKGSIGFPGKNTAPLLGRPLAWYPMNAALKSEVVDRVFLSTDDEKLMALARQTGVEVIERPAYLCTKEALGEDAYKHGYEEITKRLGKKPELLVLLFCNAPTVSPNQIREGVSALRKNPDYDSAITVSRYNMWSPIRARRIDSAGLMKPFIPFEDMAKSLLTTADGQINCDRDSQGDVWFADVAMSVVRPKNLDRMEEGLLPQKWMGQSIFPIKNEAGLDVDYEWQMPQAEWWLRNQGFKDVKFENDIQPSQTI
jgi:hypothetical protein